MKIVDYETIQEVNINMTAQNNWDYQWNSVPWINSPSIDAKTQVVNLPEGNTWWIGDIAWWSTNLVRTATDYNTISWSTWSINLKDWTTYSISPSGSTGNMTSITYIYIDVSVSTTALQITTTASTAVWANKILVAVCKPVTDTAGKAIVQPFGTVWTDIFITADNIAANTITANEIDTNYVYAGTINADNITSGTITGRTVRTASSWQRVVVDWTNNRVQFYDTWWNDCWYMRWLYVDLFGWYYTVAFSKPISTTIGVFTNGIISWWTLYPDTDWTLDLWNWSYRWNNLYLNGWLNFDNWDWVLTEVSGTPRWNNWTNYWILMSDATTSTSSLTATGKISVNIAGTTFKLLYNNT